MDENNKNINEESKIKKSRKSLAFNTIAIITIVAVIVISVIFNIIFANLVPAKIDLTKNKEFTVSKEATDYVKSNVGQDVEVIGFFDPIKKDIDVASYVDNYVAQNINKIMEVLDTFKRTNGHVKVRYVDPVMNNVLFKQLVGTDEANYTKGDFMVMSGNRKRHVTKKDLVIATYQQDPYSGQPVEIPYAANYDGAFVGAIISVTSAKQPVVGLVTDHQEKSLDQTGPQLRKELENRAFVFKDVKLATDKLTGINVLMFLGSQADLLAEESTKLTEFLNGGGNAVFLMDPTAVSLTNFNNVLSLYNISLNNDVVTEGEGNYLTAPYDLYEQITPPEGSPFTDLKGNIRLYQTRSLGEIQKSVDYLKSYPLIYSTTGATRESVTSGGGSVKGRALLCTAVESSGNKLSKIFVAGTTSVLQTGMTEIISAMTWMEGTTDFSAPIKKPVSYALTISESSKSLIGIIVILLVPLLIFALGTFVWLRRRHL